MDAGGACNFGCSTGKCACSAPDRFSYFTDGFPIPGPSDQITDKKYGKRWLVRDANADFDTAKLVCATNNNMRLPTLSELKSIVAQQPDAIQCGASKNLDKTFVDSFKEYVSGGVSLDTPLWSSDLDPQGKTFVVQLTTGEVSTRDPAQKLPVIVLCIQKDQGSGAAGAAGSSGAAGAGGASGSGGAGGSGGAAACQVGPAFDFDKDNGGFLLTGSNSSWAWGSPSGSFAPAGDHTSGGGSLWGTNTKGTANLCENSFLESPMLDLTAYSPQPVTLEVWSWLDLRECDPNASLGCNQACNLDKTLGGTSQSGGVLQVFNGVGWDTVAPQGGYQSGTMKIECHSPANDQPGDPEYCQPCDLDGKTGFTANTPQKAWVKFSWDVGAYAYKSFKVRFNFASFDADPCWVNSGGWYIDDIRFTTACP